MAQSGKVFKRCGMTRAHCRVMKNPFEKKNLVTLLYLRFRFNLKTDACIKDLHR